MKTRNIAYWTTTILVAFFIGIGGVAQVAHVKETVDGFVHILGYPPYFVTILGIWKVLGAIAILVPGFPRLKEWAYAGIFFDLTGAAASNASVGGLRRLWLSHHRPSRHCWSSGGVVGAASTEPCCRRPFSCDKREGGINSWYYFQVDGHAISNRAVHLKDGSLNLL